MNTPAHSLINLAILAKSKKPAEVIAVFLGSIIPDLPMFFFYGYVKFIKKLPEKTIWETEYFKQSWHDFFDITNSIPLIIALLILNRFLKSKIVYLFSLSCLLHFLIDLPLHNVDAHRHFYPLSNWKFISPVSYWDPKHYGNIVILIEVILSIASGYFFLSNSRNKTSKTLGILLLSSYLVFLGAAFIFWA